MIKVLIVEDSTVVRDFLIYILGSDPDIDVVGTAQDGIEAIELVPRLKPDVITMDIHMPRMHGLDATRIIMESTPTPIVIVSGSENLSEVVTTFNAMEAGALAVLARPAGIDDPSHPDRARELVRTVKLMAEVKVVRRWPRHAPMRQAATSSTIPQLEKMRIVALGASTGGPPALQTILSSLPENFPVPIVIVQHMATGFTQGFADWLALTTALKVNIPAHGQTMQPGHVYIAPDGWHMKVAPAERLLLTDDPPEHGLRPAVSYLFRSIADVYGNHAVAGLLTGMGRDGAEELRILKHQGALTIAQDKDSSVVYGMPNEAIRLDAARLVMPPEKIAETLTQLSINGHVHWRNP